ncbi:MAG: protein-glutamate O-methyltransferase CheR [Candidatus Nitrosotenuis sp.]|nr:MAG: protein-glutamate O-methyltransferase CheR [Candidatus Nitrosotenuis sp.]
MSLNETISDQQLLLIEKIMQVKTGKDLHQFKRLFLNRRINARMKAVGVRDGSEYAKLLESNSTEPSALFKSFSINVTEFYRDSFVWECMSSKIIPQILKNSGSFPLQVWSAGCASGEEPYSLAILLKEIIGTKNVKFNIIATDISADAISRAKHGQYLSQSLKNLSPHVVTKYFTPINNNTYQISESIKQLVTFQQGDIISFPIEHINLITCRNVLIYYDKPAQELVFKKFHKTLNDDGYLVIGQDETMLGVGTAKSFSCILPRERIYSKLVSGGNTVA